MSMLDLAALLGSGAEAISPQDSWQQRLGQTAGEMAGQEQDRRFLADLLSGMPDPSGRHGLSPEVVLQGMNLRHQIEQSRPQPVEMAEVDTPFGPQQIPAEDVADYQRKIWAEQHSADPTAVREFEWVASQPEEVQKSYMEFIEQRNPSMAKEFAQILAEQEARQRQTAEVKKDIEYGTVDHWSNTEIDPRAVTDEYTQRLGEGEENITARQVEIEQRLRRMIQDLEEFHGDKYEEVMYRNLPQQGGRGFYGRTPKGQWELIKQFTPRR